MSQARIGCRRDQAQQPQESPRQASRPSRTAIPAITSAATGSAHHQPATAFATRPASSAADMYAQSIVCRLSLVVAEDPSRSPTRRLATASGGMVASVTTERTIPTQLASG